MCQVLALAWAAFWGEGVVANVLIPLCAATGFASIAFVMVLELAMFADRKAVPKRPGKVCGL